MGLDYDPLWDEQGQLRRGCTVREALAWLTKFGSHSAGEDVCVRCELQSGCFAVWTKPACRGGQTHFLRL